MTADIREHDLIVIGAGPGGYVAAIRAAQLGLDVACIEKEPRLGGTCLRVGCIPSKALLESSEIFHAARTSWADHGVRAETVALDLDTMMQRKESIVEGLTRGVAGLFLKNGITRYLGHARLDGPGRVVVAGDEGEGVLSAKHVLIATGSRVTPLPGVQLDGEWIGTSTEGLAFEQVPERLVVIGAGFIGLELGSVWSRLGSQVTIVEYQDRILPGIDAEIAREAHKLFKRQGLEFKLGTRVTAAARNGDGCRVELDGAEPIDCDRVLLAVGRMPNTEGLGLESVGLELDARGRIPVEGNYATAQPGLFAIGDVIAGPMLAHKAEEEGMACVEGIVNGYGHVDYDTIPGIVYTNPEIASVGKTEDELKQAGVPYNVGSFPFLANGRARAIGNTSGRVKVLAHEETDRLLGVHVIGPHAGDLIAEAAAALTFGASSEDLARTCHAHPTLSEALKEAALAVSGRAIHA